jgi:hypothetical protein
MEKVRRYVSSRWLCMDRTAIRKTTALGLVMVLSFLAIISLVAVAEEPSLTEPMVSVTDTFCALR